MIYYEVTIDETLRPLIHHRNTDNGDMQPVHLDYWHNNNFQCKTEEVAYAVHDAFNLGKSCIRNRQDARHVATYHKTIGNIAHEVRETMRLTGMAQDDCRAASMVLARAVDRHYPNLRQNMQLLRNSLESDSILKKRLYKDIKKIL